jgi:NitT/TauT family transport system ATP-binding protein
MTTNQQRLVASNLTHHYDTPSGGLLAINEVSFALANQSFTCLIGPSGCGKSTLLKILAGLLRPDEGQVSLNGHPLNAPSRDIGIVFQNATLMPWRTVEKNLVLPLEIEGASKAEQERHARRWLDLLGLAEFADTYPAGLSGGMAQRLAVGRALIHNPDVLLLDEPFGALDALTREQVSEELLSLWAEHRKTVLMVTHSIREAILLADRVLVMSPRPGQIVQDIPINLPRPRTLKMFLQHEFALLEEQVRTALRLT